MSSRKCTSCKNTSSSSFAKASPRTSVSRKCVPLSSTTYSINPDDSIVSGSLHTLVNSKRNSLAIPQNQVARRFSAGDVSSDEFGDDFDYFTQAATKNLLAIAANSNSTGSISYSTTKTVTIGNDGKTKTISYNINAKRE